MSIQVIIEESLLSITGSSFEEYAHLNALEHAGRGKERRRPD